jgi:hypothetical protein
MRRISHDEMVLESPAFRLRGRQAAKTTRFWTYRRQPLPKPATEGLPVIRPHLVANFSEATYGRSCGRGQSRVVFVAGQPKVDYKFAPKTNRRPSQSFTTNSRECHGIVGKSTREFHASSCILSAKRVRIFDEYICIEQFVRLFVGVGCGRFGTAEVNSPDGRAQRWRKPAGPATCPNT